jgi:hypothetical protein
MMLPNNTTDGTIRLPLRWCGKVERWNCIRNVVKLATSYQHAQSRRL